MVEVLHYDVDDAYETVAWRKLKASRKLFVGPALSNQYVGLAKYVGASVHLFLLLLCVFLSRSCRALASKEDAKSRYLAARLLTQAAHLIDRKLI